MISEVCEREQVVTTSLGLSKRACRISSSRWLFQLGKVCEDKRIGGPTPSKGSLGACTLHWSLSRAERMAHARTLYWCPDL